MYLEIHKILLNKLLRLQNKELKKMSFSALIQLMAACAKS